MSNRTTSLRRKISSAGDLQSVVRTMKALAAANIGQLEQSVRALEDYFRILELGLSLGLRNSGSVTGLAEQTSQSDSGAIVAVVFGSDLGLVGPFNEVIANLACETLAALSVVPEVWAVGELVHAHLEDAGVVPTGYFSVPSSVKGITPLVGRILLQTEMHRRDAAAELHLFYNRPVPGAAFAPNAQRLLPLDETWCRNLTALPWPGRNLPEVLGGGSATLRALIREYLFAALFRACAESVASENASRLAAMQRADKNIGELLTDLKGAFHRLRQSGIDEELFDIVAGFEALAFGDMAGRTS